MCFEKPKVLEPSEPPKRQPPSKPNVAPTPPTIDRNGNGQTADTTLQDGHKESNDRNPKDRNSHEESQYGARNGDFDNQPPSRQGSEVRGSGDLSNLSRPPSGVNGPLKIFRFRELVRATENFKDPDMVLGRGGFGTVYKGWLRDPGGGKPFPVAIKRLNPDSFQGQQEWLQEIMVLGALQHPNLVKLYGYCADNHGEGLLIYEFMPRASLDYHLFPDADPGSLAPVLEWPTRLQIALDAATGLAYLHENNIIHRDFKAPNILLDENYNAKLTDFGLAKAADSGQSHVTTRIMGTLGYLDPRYMETGQLTKKSDVYAFGVLLLELLTGRRAVDPDDDRNKLTTWVRELLVNRRPDVFQLVDAQLHDQFSTKAAQRAAQKVATSAKHCIELDPVLRPQMTDMVETLRPLVAAAKGQQ